VFNLLYSSDTLLQSCFLLDLGNATLVEWHHACRPTEAKVLDNEPRFVGTEQNPIQVDEACIAGVAKYRKGRRLAGDRRDQIEDETDVDAFGGT